MHSALFQLYRPGRDPRRRTVKAPPPVVYEMPTEETVTAYHEAGHAVAGVVGGLHVNLCSIEPRSDPDGRGWVSVGWTGWDRGCIDVVVSHAIAITTAAGPVAQERITGMLEIHTAERQQLIDAMAFGMSGVPRDEERDILLTVSWARDLLARQWAAVEVLASALLLHRVLDGPTVRAIVTGAMELEKANAR